MNPVWPSSYVTPAGTSTRLTSRINGMTTHNIFFPLTGGCSEGLGAFRFFFKHNTLIQVFLIVYSARTSLLKKGSSRGVRRMDIKLLYYRLPGIDRLFYEHEVQNHHTDLRSAR